MSRDQHWNEVYTRKKVAAVSWYRPHLDTSLRLIRDHAPDPDSRIIDVGCGASTLIDDLLEAGYTNLTVLEVSTAALAILRERLGPRALGVEWIAADVTRAELAEARYDVWHDRAVLHFLTDPAERSAYVERAARAVRPGGIVIVAPFSDRGPPSCSGLPVHRYSVADMAETFAPSFDLEESVHETHTTPSGNDQAFVYGVLRRRDVDAS